MNTKHTELLAYENRKKEILKRANKDYFTIETKRNSQSIQFIADMLPIIRHLYPGKGKKITVLDVGSRTAAGSALLAKLHSKSTYAKIKMDVTALDIDDTFKEYVNFCYPELKYVVKDIFDYDESVKWDLVICSHTIEHVHNPEKFLSKLIDLCRDFTIIACPFEEDKNNLIPEHCNSIDYNFIDRFKPIKKFIYDGMYWHQSLCGIFVFKGGGDQ